MRLQLTIPDDSIEASILGGLLDPTTFILQLVREKNELQNLEAQKKTKNPEKVFEELDKLSIPRRTKKEVKTYIRELRDEW